ncbi:MAG TPA: APC family permease [Blastocatellia bacterium]|nr:APC family permease [Blastocatellia bacterium]
MKATEHDHTQEEPHLIRHFSTLQATALNMSNMIGIGPFITIPLLMGALYGTQPLGPYALAGWIVAALIVICDGLVWSELGAAMPGSGGSYVYLREAFGNQTFGRLMAFLFIWQFFLSGPLEIASGYKGFAQYLGYVWKGMSSKQMLLIAAAVGVVNIALLYRRISHIGRLTVSLWIGTLLTTAIVILTGAMNFDPKLAFDFPAVDLQLSPALMFGLGAASSVGVYDYLGYYDICYLGDEVRNPGKVIPRSVIISVIGVALIYFATNLSITGVLSWRQFIPSDPPNPLSFFVVSVMMEKIYGSGFATIFTFLILWTAFGSVFALLLGYSRIPYAAARDGYFFSLFARVHPRKNFPHISLVLIGAVAIVCSFFPLDFVIGALLTTRILVQFIGQIFAVMLLRKRRPDLPRPYRIWLYPLPVLIALIGWIFIFTTADRQVIIFGLGTLAPGIIGFFIWSRLTRRWPFEAQAAAAD